MLFQKLRPFALAFFLLMLLCSMAVAQQPAPNPPLTDDQANAGLAAGGIGCVCVLIVVLVGLAINIAILVWVYKDAKARGAEPMLWLLLVFFTGLIGLIIWLIVRPPLQGPPV